MGGKNTVLAPRSPISGNTPETPRAGPAPRPARPPPPPPPRNPPPSRHPPAPLPLCSWQVPAVAATLLLHLSGAGPAPAQRTPSGRWLQGKGRVTTGKGQAHDQQPPGRTTPRPHLTPAGSAVHGRVVTIARLKSSNIKHRLSITGATWPQSRKEAFRRQPHGQASPGLEPQSSLPGCPPSERETKLFACLLVGLF